MILVTGRANGGSRIPIRILREAGLKATQSGDLGGTQDTYCLMMFAHRWLAGYLVGGETPDMVDAWHDAVRALANDDVAKEVRTAFYLPFVDKYTPDLKVIHIVRDVRDHLVKESSIEAGKIDNTADNVFRVLSDNEVEHMSRAECVAWEWNRRHTDANIYGTHRMPGRYLVLRLEDIVTDPVGYARKILDFAGKDAADAEAVGYWIEPRKSIGRWRERADEFDTGVWSRAVGIARPALVRFGYTQ